MAGVRKGPAESENLLFKDRGPAGVSPGFLATAPGSWPAAAKRRAEKPGNPGPNQRGRSARTSERRGTLGCRAERGLATNLTDTPASRGCGTLDLRPDSPASLQGEVAKSRDLELRDRTWLPRASRSLSLWLCALARPSRLGPRSFPGRVPGRSEQSPRSSTPGLCRVKQDGTIPGQW